MKKGYELWDDEGDEGRVSGDEGVPAVPECPDQTGKGISVHERPHFSLIIVNICAGAEPEAPAPVPGRRGADGEGAGRVCSAEAWISFSNISLESPSVSRTDAGGGGGRRSAECESAHCVRGRGERDTRFPAGGLVRLTLLWVFFPVRPRTLLLGNCLKRITLTPVP